MIDFADQVALETFGRVDAVVSNAEIFTSVPFDELAHADWTRMLRVWPDPMG